MLNENFKFFALLYLNDWILDDEGFVNGLLPNAPSAKRLKTFHAAAKYYKVTRNFKTDATEVRLSGALAALDKIGRPRNEDAVDSAVCTLAAALEAKYGKYTVSAASKFLWLRHRAPVVIYDGQAVACLRSNCGVSWNCDYSAYRKAWRTLFARHATAIRAACAGLVHIRDYSLAASWSERRISEVTSRPWFHERVFDKFLWWNA